MNQLQQAYEKDVLMAEPFLNELENIIKSTKISTGQPNPVQCKHFFSGAAAYCDGTIFMSLSPVGLALKLSDEDCQEMMEMGGTYLRYFPKAPIKKGYVVLPVSIRSDINTLTKLIVKSMTHIQP